MSQLIPCPGCTRHVRASEPACPFCTTALPTVAAEPSAAESARPSRHALMFGVAAGAIAVSTALLGSGCFAYGAPSPPADAGVQPDADNGDSGPGR